ncbi:calpain-like protein [Perkinsela sp. CCAP 1560/4]|nr:calpain-like protein [Perkinsela sp. CCAP 1560/4]KNH08550.1 calpain-like protein [Perkinsela sp. CCAP 1560/4]|eukprot:KNH04025.1 calpain-like protein [Perkinsela sp. CCAP 1560/4]
MSSESSEDHSRAASELRNLLDDCQFEIDRLSFTKQQSQTVYERARLDTTAGFGCATIFSLLVARIWPVLRPVDSILYRNRFVVPQLPDWIAKLTNVYPGMCCLTAGYSLATGTMAAFDWKKERDALLTDAIRIDEKRHFMKEVQKRFPFTRKAMDEKSK